MFSFSARRTDGRTAGRTDGRMVGPSQGHVPLPRASSITKEHALRPQNMFCCHNATYPSTCLVPMKAATISGMSSSSNRRISPSGSPPAKSGSFDQGRRGCRGWAQPSPHCGIRLEDAKKDTADYWIVRLPPDAAMQGTWKS